MRNRNTMAKRSYLYENLYWALLGMAGYRSILFAPLPGVSVRWSKLALWAVVLGLVALGVLLTWNRRRNDLSVSVNVLLPYELYAAASYCLYLPGLVWGTVICGGIAALSFFLLVMLQRMEEPGRIKRIVADRVTHGLLGARTILAVCMIALLLSVGVRLVFGHGLIGTHVGRRRPASRPVSGP